MSREAESAGVDAAQLDHLHHFMLHAVGLALVSAVVGFTLIKM